MEIGQLFRDNIDELIKFAYKYDPELVDGIKWLDGKAQKKGISFYEMTYEVLEKHDVKENAKEWLRDKQNDTTVSKN